MEHKIKNIKPDIRYLKEMRNVVYDKRWLKAAPDNLELYYMYRGIKKNGKLRYDILVIPSVMLGEEFNKTKGHEHRRNFSEVYITLKGEAIYLLQKREGNKIEDVYAIKTKKGDVVIVPPRYGHITINPSKKEIKTANWISETCKNDYSFFEKIKGACYYYTKSGWIKNKNYKKVPKLRFEKPLKKIPKDLSFLKG